MNDNIERIKKVTLNAIKEAGKMLVKEFIDFDRDRIKLKAHHEIVTRCDLLSEEIIIKAVKKNFPLHNIVSEEKGMLAGPDKYTWYIDPIDGTTNFTIHNPLWCVSIAVAEEDELLFGAVYAPMMDELFYAAKGDGAILIKNGRERKIFVSEHNHDKVINTFCHGNKKTAVKKAIAYFRKQKMIELDCRQMGSAAIELAFVAAGRVESFLAPGTHDWDVAAGALIVREAGGRVTDFKNRPWRIGGVDIAASNVLVHGQILKVVNSR